VLEEILEITVEGYEPLDLLYLLVKGMNYYFVSEKL